ncbi:MAG: hypothetical protein DCF27_14085 [Lysobacteraceae bacterium]|jgi:hypothetical protein|nr:MAG: hypothetical protein DCF27_14085 [Xanthomonadaceae bacterium]
MNKAPVWFVVVAVLALLWNLIGCLAIAADLAVLASGAVATLPAEQQALYAARPAWTVIGSCVAVLAGAAGCLGLLLRRRWATPLLVASLAGVVVQDAGFLVMNSQAPLPMFALVMQGGVLVIAIALLLLARLASRRAWLG